MDGGFYLSKPGGLFRKITREGVSDVLGRWIMDGWLRTDGREKGAPAWNSSSGGGAAMDGGKKVTGEHGTVATGHDSKNRGHRESERGQANSARPRARPEVAVGAGAAMAGGESSRAHAKQGLQATKLANNRTGRKRGGRGSHRAENGG